MVRRLIPVLLLILGGYPVAAVRAEGEPRRSEIVVRQSMFNHVIIRRTGSVVSFRRLENGGTISAIDLANPLRQVIPYTATLFAPALVNCCPTRVLNIGLGAGAFDRLFEEAFAQSRLVTVEVDPMIPEIAQTYTGFRKGDRAEVVIADGRRYLLHAKTTWDWIVLDAYVRRSRIPLHLTTLEFYRLVGARLTPGGVFVASLMSGNALFQSHVKTLTAAFSQVVFFPVPERSNVIAMGVNFTDPDLMRLIGETDLGRLPDLTAWGVDFQAIRKSATLAISFTVPGDTKILTDDHAPVEFLDVRPAR